MNTKRRGGPEITLQQANPEKQIEQESGLRSQLGVLRDAWGKKAEEHFALPLGHTSAIKGQAFRECAGALDALLADMSELPKPGAKLEPKESPEETAERFIDFVTHIADDMNAGGGMWASSVEKLLGVQPDFKSKLVEAYKMGGTTRMKTRFIEELYLKGNDTGASSLYGFTNILEKVVDFK